MRQPLKCGGSEEGGEGRGEGGKKEARKTKGASRRTPKTKASKAVEHALSSNKASSSAAQGSEVVNVAATQVLVDLEGLGNGLDVVAGVGSPGIRRGRIGHGPVDDDALLGEIPRTSAVDKLVGDSFGREAERQCRSVAAAVEVVIVDCIGGGGGAVAR